MHGHLECGGAARVGSVSGVVALVVAATMSAPAVHDVNLESTGGCCLPDGMCVDGQDVYVCLEQGGTFLGDGTFCPVGFVYTALTELAVPDDSPIGVSHTMVVDQSFPVDDLNVGIAVTHAYVGDLCVTLSHGGTTVQLIQRPGADSSDCHQGSPFGCGAADYNVVLDDDGTGGSIQTVCADNLVSPPHYTPQSALSAFEGMEAQGPWTINVSDNAGGDVGTLDDWTMFLLPACPEPTGACCLQSGVCADDVTEPDCVTAGGDYLGNGTGCPSGSSAGYIFWMPIPDGDPAGVSHTHHWTGSFPVVAVEVVLLLSHTWVGDLCVTLEHNGTTVALLERPGAATGACHQGFPSGCDADDYYYTVLADGGAGGPIELACEDNLASPPTYAPEEPLAAFAGMNPAGDWTLTVSDNAPVDTGVFEGWELRLFPPCTCPGPGNCFVEHGNPGCQDPTCCATVCEFDPGCCGPSAEWDAYCVYLAMSFCSFAACPGAGQCLQPHESVGCSDDACCNAVCQEDPTCCQVAWDEACVEWADALCALCPGDVDGSGVVDVQDLIMVIVTWGCVDPPGPCAADADGDGVVDVGDLVLIVLNWGPCA